MRMQCGSLSTLCHRVNTWAVELVLFVSAWNTSKRRMHMGMLAIPKGRIGSAPAAL
jgi:hypothetical protein